jgi:hypothetical protein
MLCFPERLNENHSALEMGILGAKVGGFRVIT